MKIIFKIFIKKLLQNIFSVFLYQKKIRTKLNYTIYSVKGKHTFFGYYDFTPFSKDDTLLIANVVDSSNKPMTIPQVAEIGYFKLNNPNIFYRVGESTTWSWQQGCRLRWYADEYENRKIIYNKIINSKYGSVIFDISQNKVVKTLNHPFYDITRDGKSALSLNFSRLHRLRPGYGYVNLPDLSIKQNHPDNDGIWFHDIHQESSELIISLDFLASFEPHDTMINSDHYINHISLNPSSERFLFFHLWQFGKKRYSRIFTSDLSGNSIRLINNEPFVSHYCWIDDKKIIVTSSFPEDGLKYRIYEDSENCQLLTIDDQLETDGHPSYIFNINSFISDTYPNTLNNQDVFIYNFETNKKNRIARFNSSSNFKGEFRCDLHPRLNYNTDAFCVDYGRRNHREMVVLKNII